MRVILEACVETLSQCVAAERNGADRLELCADLHYDGLTPPIELIREVQLEVTIPIHVMIRPRPGDFTYTDDELDRMAKSIEACKALGVAGVVFGICKGEQLDLAVIKRLSILAKPLKVVIHKAIDVCANPLEDLKRLIDLQTVDGVLTSGKARTAYEGMHLLQRMVALAGDELEVIACGKVTTDNLDDLKNQLPARAWHGKLIVGELGDNLWLGEV